MATRLKVLLVSALLVLSVGASAATFNLFSPAAGILKGNPSTYVTTAATAVDIVSTFSGTCNSSTFLRGDGACAAAGGGGGTVTSIAAGTGITATPSSPITTSGTLAVDEAFSPTWTGTHTFANPIEGVGGTVSMTNGSMTQFAITSGVPYVDGFGNVEVRAGLGGSGDILMAMTGVASITGAQTDFNLSGNFSVNAGGDTLITNGTDSIYMSAGNIDLTTPTGQVRVNIMGDGVKNICLQDGTNCPAAGGDATLAGNQTFTGLNTFSNDITVNGVSSASWANLDLQNTFLLSTGSAASQSFINTSTGTTAGAQWDAANSANAVQIGITSTGFSGAKLTGGPTGQSAYINTNSAAVPLTLGTNGIARLSIDTDGDWTVGGGVGTSGQVLTSNGSGSAPSWQSAGGSGTVTSVGLTMPSGLSVGGSPVTTSGTLAVTTTLNGVVKGNGSGFTASAVALGSEVSGTLPVANGGTGTTTSTGTGSVVLSASPTLTGTTTAATVAATTVTVGGNNVCQSTGTNCPTGGAQTAFATISVSAGVSCSINSSYDNANISSCQWLSAGAYNLELSIGAGTFPTCTVTPFNAAGYIARASNVDANTVGAGTYFLTDGDPVTWTASDVAFTIVCFSTG